MDKTVSIGGAVAPGVLGVERLDIPDHIMTGRHWLCMADVMRDMRGFGFKDARLWGPLKIMGQDGSWIELYSGVE